MNRAQGFSWLLVGVGFFGGATAADALPSSLRACMKETDATRRLACFDRESAVLAGENTSVAQQADPAPPRPAAPAPSAPVASAAATAGAAAATMQSATDKFGYKGNIAREDLDKQKEAEEASQLTAKVTAVSAPPNGGLVVTLDNGQVWQQKTADRALHIRVGDQVTIKRATLGSFLLTSDTVNGSMRVSRVK